MVEPAEEGEVDREGSATPSSIYELNPELVDEVEDALDRGEAARLQELIEPLHDADIADLLQHITTERRQAFVEIMRADFPPEILAELDETVREEIIDHLGVAETAAVVADLDTDDALNIIAELDANEQQLVLQAIPAADRALIEEGLAYPEESAGRLMQRELVAVPTFWNVGQTIDHLRQSAEEAPDTLPADFYDIFVVDPGHRPVGMIPLSHLLRTRRQVPLPDIMETDLRSIRADTDQEDVAFLFRQRNLTSAPVVDDGGRLVGAITVDDVVDVIDEEHEDDMMHLGGVHEDDFYSDAMNTARTRFTWLFVNLGTAILASLVIGLFDATIEQMVALAVLMPIVASMGGNAGTQTLTVAVRAIATKELSTANASRLIGKELLVGGVNGILFALILGLIAWLWFGNAELAVVLGLAIIVNLIVAAVSGAATPLILERLKVDPAVASSVILTTITDVVGFFAFLGLAALFLLK